MHRNTMSVARSMRRGVEGGNSGKGTEENGQAGVKGVGESLDCCAR